MGSSKRNYDKWHESMVVGEQGNDGSRLQPWHETVLKLLPDLNGRDVLEIGCGRGYFSFELMRRFPLARIHGVDFSDKAIDLAKQRCSKSEGPIEFSVGDAQALLCTSDVRSPISKRLFRPFGRHVLYVGERWDKL